MAIMLPLSEKEPIGKRSKGTSRNKECQNKTSNSYRFLVFNTL